MTSRLLKNAASGDRHGALTISRPYADMRRLIRRLAYLASFRPSTYPARGKAALAAWGWVGGKGYASAQDTAGSPSRRRAQSWRHLFVTPCASLRPCWTSFMSTCEKEYE